MSSQSEVVQVVFVLQRRPCVCLTLQERCRLTDQHTFMCVCVCVLCGASSLKIIERFGSLDLVKHAWRYPSYLLYNNDEIRRNIHFFWQHVLKKHSFLYDNIFWRPTWMLSYRSSKITTLIIFMTCLDIWRPIWMLSYRSSKITTLIIFMTCLDMIQALYYTILVTSEEMKKNVVVFPFA